VYVDMGILIVVDVLGVCVWLVNGILFHVVVVFLNLYLIVKFV